MKITNAPELIATFVTMQEFIDAQGLSCCFNFVNEKDGVFVVLEFWCKCGASGATIASVASVLTKDSNELFANVAEVVKQFKQHHNLQQVDTGGTKH